MGRVGLRRVLTIGLVLIIFLSLFASALGVAALVRNYLWTRSERESEAMALAITRGLETRRDRQPAWNRRNQARQESLHRQALERTLKRFNRGAGQLLLLKDGRVIKGGEEGDRDWSGIERGLTEGFQRVNFDGESWQVLSRSVESEMVDELVIIRPWSPSARLVRTLLLYQIMAFVAVMALAIVAVSLFSSKLARPLEELREKTKSVGRDQVEALTPSSVVEIADLQDSFLSMCQRVDEAMASQSRFVADASHELKTPLTAISGMLELLQNRPEMEPDDRKQALTVAKKEADRMESLIADLLLLSRAQAKRSGAKERVRLATLVQEQIETLALLFPEQSFVLGGDTDVEVEMNPGAFSRVARNLMENAARYGGGEPIEVSFKAEDNEVLFIVRDRGPGIPKDKLKQLFERFYRTDSGRARSDGGHGLGLAIVKALVEETGGSIRCLSEVNKGTEFIARFGRS